MTDEKTVSHMGGETCPNCESTNLMHHRLESGQWVQQCHDCLHTWEVESPGVFMGETMICAICGRQGQSDPNKSDNWRAIDIGQERHYICPKHFPPDGSSAYDFQIAYAKVLNRLMRLPRKKWSLS